MMPVEVVYYKNNIIFIGRAIVVRGPVQSSTVAGQTQMFLLYIILYYIASMQGKYTFHNIIVIRYFVIGRNVQHVMINGKRFFFIIR